jgi:UDP-2-acetamido-3-amino-2,3-dideoxy-glucuronate N-acetyltransferase
MGWVSEYGHRLSFDENGIAFCPETNQKYQLLDKVVRRIE